jgi:adenosylcobinamide-GDP ribazoletransferase
MIGDVAVRSTGWPPFVRSVRAAFAFMTRIPVGGFPYSPADWAWAPAHFPLVGLVIGGVTAAACQATQGLGAWVAATVAIAVSAWLTGALHEDGLADTFDALGGSVAPERALAILKDSRIGTYGTLALVLATLLRVGALAELGARGVTTLLLAHVLARTAPVWLILWMPYVSGTASKSAMLVTGRRTAHAVVATGWATLACLACWNLGASTVAVAVAILSVLLVGLALGVWFHRRVGGLTGDFLGATEQMSEAAVLLAVLAIARAGFV